MTANTQTIGIEFLASGLAVTDDAVADEIRVVQSVQTQHFMPGLLYGNVAPVLLIFYIDWSACVTSQAVYFLAAVLVMLLPMLRSYRRLRSLPRPIQVSKRRIRRIETYSLLLALVWAVAITLLMRRLSHSDGVVVILLLTFVAYGAGVQMPSLPKASVAFSVPVIIASYIGAYTNNIMNTDLLILICFLGTAAIARAAWQNWQDVIATVRLSLENLRAETEQKLLLEKVSIQLAKYISPQLYQSIFSGEQKVEIASKRKKLTVFFSDIVNFTEITDQLESEELTALLNRYLTEMSIIAQEHGAYFDKFIGDAMMFYFGDPETRGAKEDASACVRMAIAMQRRLRELEVGWREQGLINQPFETRMGINTGYCTVGNFGSEDRMDHTIIGGEVNLAARLEAQAEAGGILMASETYSLVKDWLLAEEQETITMKGFAKPVRNYQVTGIYDELAAEGRIIRSDIDGLSLTINPDHLNTLSKTAVIQQLNDAIAQLEK